MAKKVLGTVFWQNWREGVSMPTYQYVCQQCEQPLEVVQSFHDEPLTECPTCGGELRKLFSAAGVVFKGSGFYRTDSRSSSGSTSD
jgi:putative FmdB family regulatory protein